METKPSAIQLPSSSSDNQHRWAPLSYPSAAIFAAASQGRRGDGHHASIARSADPFFPLHRDVLLAAMRELLIIGGKIDPRRMEVIGTPQTNPNSGKIVPANPGPAESKLKRKEAGDPSGDDQERADRTMSLKKQRTQNSSVESLPILHMNEAMLEAKHNPHPHVIPIPVDQLEQKVPFDYSQFTSAESLVKYAVEQAVLVPGNDILEYHSSQAPMKKVSQRKVSDADSMEESHNSSSDFPTHIVSLVRSNILLLETSQSGSKLSKLASQPGSGHEQTKSTHSGDRDPAIVSFLRNPRLQREQQQGKESQSLFVLPRLLETPIEDECNLRARAYQIVSSMVNSFPNDDMKVPIRTFLGYRSTKLTSRTRMLEVISDVLFDLSHAMYAWVHTEEEMARQDKNPRSKTNYTRFDRQIKASLFDDRALKRIGGFEPSALLPLALGIRRCRQAERSWKEYALSHEGKIAMSIHTRQMNDCNGTKDTTKGQTSKVHVEKKPAGTVTENYALLEIGKKRRGRRGKSIMTRPL